MVPLASDKQQLNKVLVADDHTLFRRGLAMVLKNILGDIDVIESADADNALALIMDNQKFDLILLDLGMPGMENLEGLEAIINEVGDTTPVAILSAHQDSQSIRTTIEVGARGYLLKSFSEDSLRHALALIMAGEVFVPSSVLSSDQARRNEPAFISERNKNVNPVQNLTRRQRDVLNLIMRGQSNKLIARSLGLYESTVKAHIQVILEKLHADNRTHAAMIAAEWMENSAQPQEGC